MSDIALFFSGVPASLEGKDSTGRVESAIARHLDANGSPAGAAIHLKWVGLDEWQLVSVVPKERLVAGQALPIAPNALETAREGEAAIRISTVLRGEGIKLHT